MKGCLEAQESGHVLKCIPLRRALYYVPNLSRAFTKWTVFVVDDVTMLLFTVIMCSSFDLTQQHK